MKCVNFAHQIISSRLKSTNDCQILQLIDLSNEITCAWDWGLLTFVIVRTDLKGHFQHSSISNLTKSLFAYTCVSLPSTVWLNRFFIVPSMLSFACALVCFCEQWIFSNIFMYSFIAEHKNGGKQSWTHWQLTQHTWNMKAWND